MGLIPAPDYVTLFLRSWDDLVVESLVMTGDDAFRVGWLIEQLEAEFHRRYPSVRHDFRIEERDDNHIAIFATAYMDNPYTTLDTACGACFVFNLHKLPGFIAKVKDNPGHHEAEMVERMGVERKQQIDWRLTRK